MATNFSLGVGVVALIPLGEGSLGTSANGNPFPNMARSGKADISLRKLRRDESSAVFAFDGLSMVHLTDESVGSCGVFAHYCGEHCTRKKRAMMQALANLGLWARVLAHETPGIHYQPCWNSGERPVGA